MKKILTYLMLPLILLSPFKVTSHAKSFELWENIEWQEAVSEPQGEVSAKGEYLDGDILKITIIADGFESPILGTAFHLNYETDKLLFLKYEPGDFLERGGDPFYLVSNDETSGKIIFGETLRRSDNFPIGGGSFVDMYFQIVRDEDMVFSFERGVVSTLDIIRQDLVAVEWTNLKMTRDDKKNASPTQANLLDSRQTLGNSPVVFYSTLSIFVLLLTIFFIKKMLHNRHQVSVNFK